MTTGLPFDDYRQLLKTLPGPDEAARARAAQRNARLSGQGPSLGRLGEIAEWLAAWTGREPQVLRPLVALFAGTHRGVAGSREATQAMVEHAAAGGAMVCQLCAANDLGLKIFDLALHVPVGDIAVEPSLDERGCAATMAFGMEAIAGGIDLVCVGAAGVGGALSAAAKRYCCTKELPSPTTSRPMANSQKLLSNRANVATTPPSAVTRVPPMKPLRRPSHRISAAAGSAPSATPILNPVTGAVASDLSAARR